MISVLVECFRCFIVCGNKRLCYLCFVSFILKRRRYSVHVRLRRTALDEIKGRKKAAAEAAAATTTITTSYSGNNGSDDDDDDDDRNNNNKSNDDDDGNMQTGTIAATNATEATKTNQIYREM